MPDKAVEKTAQEGSAITPRIADSFAEWLKELAENNEGSKERSYEIAAGQLDKILTAESAEDIMSADEGGTHQGKDMIDFEMEVDPIDWPTAVMKSSEEFDTPLGVYIQIHGSALMDFPSENITVGEQVTVSTGAPLVIGKLRALSANGHLPMPVKFLGIKAPRGTVLKLGSVPKRAVRG